jgi:hypothetical protein
VFTKTVDANYENKFVSGLWSVPIRPALCIVSNFTDRSKGIQIDGSGNLLGLPSLDKTGTCVFISSCFSVQAWGGYVNFHFKMSTAVISPLCSTCVECGVTVMKIRWLHEKNSS